MTTETTAAAFVAGKTSKCHNAHTDGTQYTLHKSVICIKVGNTYKFHWCGYYTPTTAAHMNNILDILGQSRVSYAVAKAANQNSFTV